MPQPSCATSRKLMWTTINWPVAMGLEDAAITALISVFFFVLTLDRALPAWVPGQLLSLIRTRLKWLRACHGWPKWLPFCIVTYSPPRLYRNHYQSSNLAETSLAVSDQAQARSGLIGNLSQSSQSAPGGSLGMSASLIMASLQMWQLKISGCYA